MDSYLLLQTKVENTGNSCIRDVNSILHYGGVTRSNTDNAVAIKSWRAHG